MNQLDLHLENCYGIKKMIHSFDFTQSDAHIVYAPNGIMKSSLAHTFEDIIQNSPSKDRIFDHRPTHRNIKIDGNEINADQIFVIQRMKEVDFKDASTLLANQVLKDRFDQLNTNLTDAKKDFIKMLSPHFGVKENLIETEIGKIYNTHFFESLEKIEETVKANENPILTGIKYSEIFNDKVIGFLSKTDFKVKIRQYIEVYDKLLSESENLFMKGTFNPYNADTVTKSLKENNFFKANHKLKIKEKEISDIAELEDLIRDEKEKVLKDPELNQKFLEIDKALNSNTELRNFRNYVEENQEIIKEFLDLANFKKKLLVNYVSIYKAEFEVLLKKYRETNVERLQIIEAAKLEQTDWKNVLDIFNRRFTVPFKVIIKNQEDVILKQEAPSLMFEYIDGLDKKELGGTELHENLSTGEQRVFYLLNIIFQIEARKKLPHNQLMLVDDIADSFDYKNKYAIIEYLKDVLDDPKFRMIVLTHNFDFYKTVKSRFGGKINYQGNWRTIKTDIEIKLVVGEKNDVFPTLRQNYDSCDFTFIACVPFVRNLIEFSIGINANFLTLTSVLHLKPENAAEGIKETKDISKQDVLDIFNGVFNLAKTTTSPNEKIFDLIHRKAAEIIASPQDDLLDIKSKICLSISIRLKAEEFAISKITDAGFHNNILKKQTGQIIGRYKIEFPASEKNIGILDRVNLMTPENIHVNSFMYEPLMDLSEFHLRKLYDDVLTLA